MATCLPLVSIVIPVYNHAKFVTECLDSVFNQTYPHLEVVIIDDGSSDQSVKIIENYLKRPPSSREVVFIQQANAGAHHTINRGLHLAKGEFLTILNSDDYYHPARIQTLVEQVALRGKEIGFTKVVAIDDRSERLTQYHPWSRWYSEILLDLELNCPTIGFKLLQDNLAVSTGNLFFSKTLYHQVGPFKNLKLAHDLDFILRALVLEEPVFVDQKLYYYRIHSQNSFSQLSHITEEERGEIYREYLSLVMAAPPKNISAPCHWYWPVFFPASFQKCQMERGLSSLIEKAPSLSSKTSKLPEELPEVPKEKKGKVTLISHELSLTGAPKLVADLAACLKKQGYVPHVLSMKEGPMRAEIERQGIPCSVVPTFFANWSLKQNKILKVFRFLCCLLYLFFKTEKTVICNSATTCRLLVPLTFFSFRHLFWYIHESFTPSVFVSPGFLSRIIQKAKTSQLTVLFGSKSTQEIWQESGIDGQVQYWSGISKQPLSMASQRPSIQNLLAVGTISVRKGTHYLVDAFIGAIEKKRIGDEVTLTIVGLSSDPLYASFNKELMLKILSKRMQHRIKIVECVSPDALESFYDQADLFIQPSLLECLPISLLSAMARGLPIITTDVNGCVEVIEERTGAICYARDAQGLEDVLVHAIQHPAETKSRGKEAQRVFNEKLCLEENEKTMIDLLQSKIGKG